MLDRPPEASARSLPDDRPIDRRELLVAASTLAAALGFPDGALAQGRDISAIDFASLSNAVAGFPPADPSLASHFLEAFSDRMADLADLLDIVRTSSEQEWQQRIDAAGLTPLADALATAWYTGMVGEGDDKRVVTYLDAFAWNAVGYTNPPTRCDISFGAWAEPPHEDR
jgi:hypothetical protein